MSGELAVLGSAAYEARVTPLKTGGRRDIEVTPNDANLPASFAQTDVLAVLRRFFDRLDQEAQAHDGDPVALSQGLARMEALLADVRSVRDSLRTMTASALAGERVRRLTVSGVVTVEGTTEVKRSEWRNGDLLRDVIECSGLVVLDDATGEVLTPADAAARLSETFRPDWKLTGLKALGIDPDAYCTVATDDDGRTLRTPSVRIVDNIVRRITTTTGETE